MKKNLILLLFIVSIAFLNSCLKSSYTPTPGTSDANDFIEFTNKEGALLQNELPDMYNLPN